MKNICKLRSQLSVISEIIVRLKCSADFLECCFRELLCPETFYSLLAYVSISKITLK